MTIDISQFRGMFFEEARDYVTAFEQAVLVLEREPASSDAINEMFRAAHSLKGCSATLGVDDVAGFTHLLENLLDHMREGHVSPTRELIDLLLSAGDLLAELLETARQELPAPDGLDELQRRLAEPLEVDGREATPAPVSIMLKVVPDASMLVDGIDPLPLLRELAEVVDVVTVEAVLDDLPALADLAAERCYLAWRIVVATDGDRDIEAEIREVFEFVQDTCQLTFSAADAPVQDDDTAEQLIQRSAGLERGGAEAATLRVATERVDEIINLVGELVIAQAGLSQTAAGYDNERLTEAVSQVGRTLHELQQCALSVRTLPLTTVFCRFPRLIRDLGSELEKDVRLEVVGGETELDKSVIEGLSGPITHLVRNALDHGLESPAERVAAGKPAQGVLRIDARQEHGAVVIEIHDDGRGLDQERILAKARAAGLVGAADVLSEDETYALIFEPGFSTAEQVSGVSGRGVGMDAAREAIESLNGTLLVRSKPGVGTTVRVTLPLTLAILDGFAVQTGGQGYIVPLSSVLEVVKPARDDFRTVLGQGELLSVRGDPMPLIRLRSALGMPEAFDEHAGLVVVVESMGERYGLLVDEVDGQVTVVIKALDESVRRNPALLGGTIRGDGSIEFILDLAGIQRLHRAGRCTAVTTAASGLGD